MTFAEFMETDTYQWSDVIYIVNEDGVDVDDDINIETEVVSWRKLSAIEVVIKER